MEGNYFCDADTLAILERDRRVAFRYCDAVRSDHCSKAIPMGHSGNIAGILNEREECAGHDAPSGPIE